MVERDFEKKKRGRGVLMVDIKVRSRKVWTRGDDVGGLVGSQRRMRVDRTSVRIKSIFV